jgi:hypothetical protein
MALANAGMTNFIKQNERLIEFFSRIKNRDFVCWGLRYRGGAPDRTLIGSGQEKDFPKIYVPIFLGFTTMGGCNFHLPLIFSSQNRSNSN